MAFSSTTVQPSAQAQQPQNGNDVAGPLLAALIIGAFAANKSRRHLRALQRKAMWNLLKMKFNSFFKKPAASAISTKTLLILVVAILALILLLTVSWPVALGLLLVGILIILLLKF
jgi:small-conductance mechanosensitive channel